MDARAEAPPAARRGVARVAAGPKGLGISYTAKGGSKNTPVNIAPGASQEFEVELTPSTTFHRATIVLRSGARARRRPARCSSS